MFTSQEAWHRWENNVGLKSFFSSVYDVSGVIGKSTPIGANDVFSMFNFGMKSAGVTVNTTTAMQHATVYACVRDKSESIGQLPIITYKIKPDGTKVKQFKGRDFRLLSQKPNDFMTMQDLLQMYVTCMELRGKFFAYAVRNDRGSLMEIIPFRFQTQVVPQMDMNGNVYYAYVTNDNKPNMAFAGHDIIHIKLNTLDGFTGISPIQYNSGAIGLGISQESHLSSLMKNGAMPKGLLETDSVFKNASDATRLREQFDERYAGVDNAGKSVLLENGVKFRALTISPADSELLSSRQYSQQQICGIFRVPPRRIGVVTNSKGSDIEQENKDYYVNSLMPLVTAFENAINYVTAENISIKVDERGFVRGDLESQVKGMGEAFKLTAISINEFREGISYEPIENGHLHAIDTNNITLGTLDQVEELQAEQRALNNANAQNNSGASQDAE